VSRGETRVEGERRIYSSRKRQLWLSLGLLAVYAATLSLCFEPDPDTGQKPLPGDYLWVVIPGSIALLYLVWRAMKARVETNARGIDLIRVVGHEFFPWSAIRDFEVLPTPSRRGYSVRLRQRNETLIPVRNEIFLRPIRDLDERKRLAHERAAALCTELEADRRSRLGTKPPDPSERSSSGVAVT
jgi:hypothetical protein